MSDPDYQNYQARRTFAIIAHPDAGKTTLTEQLLLLGGAIHIAGQVRARGQKRRTRADFMEIEKKRGISVSASVMTFAYKNLLFNLVDTPGHKDFSEDTYRTLSAVDSAIMVLDAAKGIESQTLKLFEVCRLRDIPIITFINKIDHESKTEFELLDEIKEKLALDVTPITWPLGSGHAFTGNVHIEAKYIEKYTKGEKNSAISETDFNYDKHIEPYSDDIKLACSAYEKFLIKDYLQGSLTPVFFGSALRCIGVQPLLNFMHHCAPGPKTQKTVERIVYPQEKAVSGFVFKIQANMDSNHRDRVAFMRICSGVFSRDSKLKIVRSGKFITISSPIFFFAKEREILEKATAGDIIGIPNHGTLNVGDSLTEGEKLTFTDIPNFAPEILKTIRATDPLKGRHLYKALKDLSEEGVVQILRPLTQSQPIVGAVGLLQVDVLVDRLKSEYKLEVCLEDTPFSVVRWIDFDNSQSKEKNNYNYNVHTNTQYKKFEATYSHSIAYDTNEKPVFMARNNWELRHIEEKTENIIFYKTQERHIH